MKYIPGSFREQISYHDFMAKKEARYDPSGFDVSDINPMLFPFQHDAVKWAIALGKSAAFLECGMGKTPISLEWGWHVANHTNKPTLTVAPLSVADQTVREGKKFGREIHYVRSQMEVGGDAQYITNYEMLKHFNPSWFGGVVIDESSILKNYTAKTKQKLIEMFATTPYRLACTATPAPNDHLELGNHAEFLGIMRSNEMISRWFINDSMSAGDYRLKGHSADKFWRWLTSWAVALSKPGDLGYSDEGYDLPELIYHDHVVGVDHTRAWETVNSNGQIPLFLGTVMSATEMHKEKRATLEERMKMAADIALAYPNESIVVWCNYNYEADILKRLLPDAIEVRGSDTFESKRRGLADFAEGRVNHIITKGEIAGHGMNWQHCGRQIFTSIDHKFEKWYQCIRRSWRFGRYDPVNIHVVYAESEGDILVNLLRKQDDHLSMQHEMVEAMKKNGLNIRLENSQAVRTGHDIKMTVPEWLQGVDYVTSN